ncbi:MAG: hypothetical protein K2Q97_01560 [Burkholderiaceae bacterium]|nr:hypothetical protein [Burkholderiaceae bacterium]
MHRPDPQARGEATDGLHTTRAIQIPQVDAGSQPMRFWANQYKPKYKTKYKTNNKAQYNDGPGMFPVYGDTIADPFIRGVQKGGTHRTTNSFMQAMKAMVMPPHTVSSTEYTDSPQKPQSVHGDMWGPAPIKVRISALNFRAY